MSVAKERGGVRAVVTKEVKKISGLLDNDITSETVVHIKVGLSKLTTYQKRLDDLDQKLFDSFGVDQESELESEMEKTFEYNDVVLETITLAKIRVSDFENSQNIIQEEPLSPPPDQNQSVNLKSTVKLPKLEISAYDGSPLGWQTFWDEFSNSIDNNEGLSDIAKFNYLKKYLTGDAEKVVAGYRLTADNYKVVIDVLKERFGNKQRAIFAHIEAMLAIPEASHEVDKLQSTSDECEKHIRSLVALGISEKTFSQFFTPIMLSKLPKFVKIELHRKNGSQEWTLDHIREWLKDEIRAREMGAHSFQKQSPPPTKIGSGPKGFNGNKSYQKPRTTGAALVSSANRCQVKCAYCNGDHYSDACDKFKDVAARRSHCEQQNLCFNCLAKGHSIKSCRKKGSCVHCNRSGHHRSLCITKFGSSSKHQHSTWAPSSNLNIQASPFVPHQNEVTYTTLKRATGTQKGVTFANPTTASQNVTVAQTECTVLETALTNVCNIENGNCARARLLFDTAGSRTFITESKQRELGLPVIRTEWISISAFQSKKRKTSKYPIVELEVVCRDGSKQMITASVVPSITCPIQKLPLDLSSCPDLGSLPLAEPLVKDVEFVPIDILIGGDHYYDFMLTNRIRFPKGPILLESKLGYITAGRVPAKFVGPETIAVMLIPGNRVEGHTEIDPSFEIQRYWELEDIGLHDKSVDPSADEHAIASFNKSVKFENSRYQVCWPWKSENPELADNLPLAKGRLRSLTRRLQTDTDLRETYEKTFSDQLSRGIIEKAPQVPDSDRIYYMPHHPVIKPDKATTKVRVVFDASSKPNKDACCLNDCVYRGPVFLEDLCGLLMRVRLHRVVIVSDIEKAFHMIELQPSERDATRFLWIKDFSKPLTGDNIIVYRFARVPFGVVSSPFLLGATIQHHLQQSDTETAKQILRGLYVDNVITGADSEEKSIAFYSEAKDLFNRASLNLREWYTNNKEVSEQIADPDKGASKNPKILGMRWNVETDTIGCSGPALPSNKPVTKRTILGAISGVYDPCGLFSPVTVTGKVLVQDLWKEGVGWDEVLSETHRTRWQKVAAELEAISVSDIPRFVGNTHDQEIQLHAFCDASQRAYSAVVYIRIGSDPAHAHLLFSRSRLAPIKNSLTIPRLELTAVCVGFRMINFVESQLDMTISSKTIWTDSQCTLHWLKKDRVSTPFVENRLKSLRECKGIKFRFVGTRSNPADLPTRGCPTGQLMTDRLWWNGPDWLEKDPKAWPEDNPFISIPVDSSESDNSEGSVLVSSALQSKPDLLDIQKFSSLTRLLRTTAWIPRFVRNLKSDCADRVMGPLTADEITKALQLWLNWEQNRLVPEFKNKEDRTWINGIGRQLQVFQDSHGILRCGGRIQNADLPYCAKHPILLPSKSPLAQLIVLDTHTKNYHSGVAHTLVALRQDYWVVKGRSFVRSVIRGCKHCKRVVGGPFRVPQMPPLPSSRTGHAIPFENTGVDHFGPLWVKEGEEKVKVWGCIFVCMVSRAIHIEMVESLSSACFLLAFRRFCAAHTVPKLVMSDNATTFRSADRALRLLWIQAVHSNEVQDFMSNHGVQWKFVVEYASWMGGFYERLIGIVKQCLKRSLFATCLRKVELGTIFAEIAQVVNCRPLVYVEDEVGSHMLHPIDLLGPGKERSLPVLEDGINYDPGPVTTSQTLVSNWRRLQKVSDNFWSTWQKQYLTSLRERQHSAKQRNCSEADSKVGMVVLIKDSLPRSQWKIGKIEKVHQSADGHIRSVTLKLANGKKADRPIKLLYPLEMSTDTDSRNSSSNSQHVSPKRRNGSTRQAAQLAKQKIAAQLEDSESESE